MDIFFGNFFWGILIILFGISLILKGFGISLPLVRVFFAIIIIMFGVKMLAGGKARAKHRERNYSKGSSMLYSSNRQEYTMVFSSGTIDLSDLPADAKDLEITVVFGSATVLLPSDLRFDIDNTSVFGATVLPQKGHFGFSEDRETLNPDSFSRKIGIESTAVFGRLEYQIVPSTRTMGKSNAPADTTADSGDDF